MLRNSLVIRRSLIKSNHHYSYLCNDALHQTAASAGIAIGGRFWILPLVLCGMVTKAARKTQGSVDALHPPPSFSSLLFAILHQPHAFPHLVSPQSSLVCNFIYAHFPLNPHPFCLQLFASQFTVCAVYTACTVCTACIACGCAVCGVCTVCGVLHIIQCPYDPYGRVILLLTCCVYLQVSYSSRILNLCLFLRRNAIRIATVRLPHVNVVYRFCSRSMQTCRVILVLT